MIGDEMLLFLLIAGLIWIALFEFYRALNPYDALLFTLTLSSTLLIGLIWIWEIYSKAGKDKRRRREIVKDLPTSLTVADKGSIRVGMEADLKIPIFLPDAIRSRHIHVLGATGSGKTESVILNFIKQDVARGLGAIILDAKGDHSFLSALRDWVPSERLRVFDLSDENSLSYNPLEPGSALESAQRLFASLNWSEEYYKSKAFSTLQRLFESHRQRHGTNPKLWDLATYLEDPDSYSAVTISSRYPKKLAEKDFGDLSGLRDQIKTLCIGHLRETLSPNESSQMLLEDAVNGTVLYFRLQSLLSSQLVTILGRLLINHLNYLAGTVHRSGNSICKNIIPAYLDEFASFACPEFADLISKARSAGIALHFSHQSIGDLTELSPGFLNRLTDNSATKIILRINDPDSAEFFARSFGTRLYQKITQRITNVKEIDTAETVGEGTQREAHQFRASPDLFKTLPTGVGSVLIAHGLETPHGASTVLKIRFPKL